MITEHRNGDTVKPILSNHHIKKCSVYYQKVVTKCMQRSCLSYMYCIHLSESSLILLCFMFA